MCFNILCTNSRLLFETVDPWFYAVSIIQILLESATLSVPWLFGGFHHHLALVLNLSAFMVYGEFLDPACYSVAEIFRYKLPCY